jgi:hypothetical protein
VPANVAPTPTASVSSAEALVLLLLAVCGPVPCRRRARYDLVARSPSRAPISRMSSGVKRDSHAGRLSWTARADNHGATSGRSFGMSNASARAPGTRCWRRRRPRPCAPWSACRWPGCASQTNVTWLCLEDALTVVQFANLGLPSAGIRPEEYSIPARPVVGGPGRARRRLLELPGGRGPGDGGEPCRIKRSMPHR